MGYLWYNLKNYHYECMQTKSLQTNDLAAAAYSALAKAAKSDSNQASPERFVAIMTLLQQQTDISELATILELLKTEIPEFAETIDWFKNTRFAELEAKAAKKIESIIKDDPQKGLKISQELEKYGLKTIVSLYPELIS